MENKKKIHRTSYKLESRVILFNISLGEISRTAQDSSVVQTGLRYTMLFFFASVLVTRSDFRPLMSLSLAAQSVILPLTTAGAKVRDH